MTGTCGLRGELLRKEECATCKGKVKKHVHACALLGEMKIEDCPCCPYFSEQSEPTISVVIPALNEEAHLPATLENIAMAGVKETIVVDDFSARPQPGAIIRNTRRYGVACSRHIGALRATGDICLFMDAHQSAPKQAYQKVARLAQTHGMAYCGTIGHVAARLEYKEDGLLAVKWTGRPPQAVAPISGWCGAFYAWRRDLLEQAGGWPCLPGWWGMDEEATSLMAIAHGWQIMCDTTAQTTHLWRGAANNAPEPDYDMPQEMAQVNIAALYRLIFNDDHWRKWKEVLAAAGIPQDLTERAENAPFSEYAEKVRARFKLTSDEIMQKVELYTKPKEQ